MKLSLEDLLIEKPLSLFFWKLSSEEKNFFLFLQKETEFRDIQNFKDFLEWISRSEVQYLILGLENPEELKENLRPFLEIPLEKRRKLFIILVSPKVQTLTNKETFLYGVNLLINSGDLSSVERILQKALLFWRDLYLPYFKAQEKFKEGWK